MMRSRPLYLLLITVLLFVIGFLLWKPKLPRVSMIKPPKVHIKPPEVKLSPAKINFKTAAFSALPGWSTTDTKTSFLAFQLSCKTFLKQDPDKSVGSEVIDLQVKDFQPACLAALLVDGHSNIKTKAFFQRWFIPTAFVDKKPINGLFTGYYMPILKGSITKDDTNNVPLYGLPQNIILVNLGLFDPNLKNRRIVGREEHHRLVPFYTREEIDKGVISKLTPVLAWIDSRIERAFLEIQGSGIIELSDGKKLTLNYAAENGAPYTSIAKVLINKGVMTKDNASMQHIRSYLEANPSEIDPVLNQNKSFVFFEAFQDEVALGAQGVVLTPGYSLAIDRKWVPLGVPIWLNTIRPAEHSGDQKIFQRLMIAQDVGGAIRGAVRGDVYWGSGIKAAAIAGKMKNPGSYWLLLPQHTVSQLKDKIV